MLRLTQSVSLVSCRDFPEPLYFLCKGVSLASSPPATSPETHTPSPHSAQGWWVGRVLLLGCKRSSLMPFTGKTGKAKSAKHWVWCGGTSRAQGRKSIPNFRQARATEGTGKKKKGPAGENPEGAAPESCSLSHIIGSLMSTCFHGRK